MTVYGIVLFILGVIFVILGAGLIVYNSLVAQKRLRSQTDQGILKTIFDFVLDVLKILVTLVGEDKAAKAGLVLVIIGFALILLPFLVL